MNNIPDEIVHKIWSFIKINTSITYIPVGDGEQTHMIFNKKIYPYTLVNNEWALFYKNLSIRGRL